MCVLTNDPASKGRYGSVRKALEVGRRSLSLLPHTPYILNLKKEMFS